MIRLPDYQTFDFARFHGHRPGDDCLFVRVFSRGSGHGIQFNTRRNADRA